MSIIKTMKSSIIFLVPILFTLIELYAYPGFWGDKLNIKLDHIFIYYSVYVNVFLLLKKSKTLVKISCTLSLLVTLLFFIESINYPNYIYSKYQISPSTLLVFSSYLFCVALLPYFSISKSKLNKAILSVFTLLIISSITFILGDALGNIYRSVDLLISKITHNDNTQPNSIISYWKLVKLYTPSNSNILIPPENVPWKFTGNLSYSLYYLYPRKLFNGSDTLSKNEDFNNSYVLISSEEYPAGNYKLWPNYFIPAKSIYLFNIETNSVQKYPGPYNPTDWIDIKPWGLLEL